MDNSGFINSYYGICMWSLVLYSVPIQVEQQTEKLKWRQTKMTAKHSMPILLLIRTFWCQSINKKRDAIWEQKKNATYQEYGKREGLEVEEQRKIFKYSMGDFSKMNLKINDLPTTGC